jgi:hypothetical protein
MGLVDFLDNVVDKVEGVADKVKQGAQWVEETARGLGLGKIADVAKSVGKFAGKFVIAPTPILQGGQKAIEEMRKSAGDGDPIERGDQFSDGAQTLTAQLPLLTQAHPNEWKGGTASAAYAEKNRQQSDRISDVRNADKEMARILSGEADAVYAMRERLDYFHRWLADFGQVTQYLGIDRRGKVVQAILETWAVGIAMSECIPLTWNTYNTAQDFARQAREARDAYKTVADGVTISDSTGDFDPPKQPSSEQPPGPGQPGNPGQPGGPNAPAPTPGGPAPAPTPGGSAPAPAPAPAPVPAPAPGNGSAPPPGGNVPMSAPATPAAPAAPMSAPQPAPAQPASQRAPGQPDVPASNAASGASGERAPVEPVGTNAAAQNPSAREA